MSRVEFWFEFASTYTYPSASRLREAADKLRVQVDWKVFLLGPIFKDLGWNDSPFNLQPAKGRYMWRDLERICANQNIPWRQPSEFPRNGLLAARIVAAHPGSPWIPDFVEAVYRANFAEDRDIGAQAVLADCLEKIGLTADAILAAANSDDAKTRLRVQTEEARSKGIFGAPSFTVGNELFWGNDRLDEALACARGWPPHAVLPPTPPPPSLGAIEKETRRVGFDMASDRRTGAFLAALAATKPGGHILEIGTGTGLATAWLASGMDAGATLLTIDSDAAVVDVARRHLGSNKRIEFRVGDGGEILDQLDAPFDLIFADAWPGKYSHLDRALSLLAPGGMYVIDDLLPQPNWPEGHAAKVEQLLDDLARRSGLVISHLDWSTGIAVATRV